MEKKSTKDCLGKGHHIMVKPVGPLCNLNCSYCFYTEKKSFFPKQNSFSISDEVLETFIKKYITSQEIPEIQFVWQGGEPSLTGLDFYKKVLSLQKKYAAGKKIINALQTNGTMLDREWCAFLKQNDFLVGLSLDGPNYVHDQYRKDHLGRPTHTRVMEGLSLLQQFGVSFNVLVCVTRTSSAHALEIYRFLIEKGVQYIQFTPIIERIPDCENGNSYLRHAAPAHPKYPQKKLMISPETVDPEAYGDFLISIFEEWVRHNVGKTFVMNFEWALEAWLGLPSTICIFSDECGRSLVMEHNGDIYSCDHYVYPDFRVGSILSENIVDIINSERQLSFGRQKNVALPRQCLNCDVLFACKGECPRHRFMVADDGEPGLSYLCAGYKKYFRHIHRYMKVMTTLIENNLPASRVMDVINGRPIAIINQ